MNSSPEHGHGVSVRARLDLAARARPRSSRSVVGRAAVMLRAAGCVLALLAASVSAAATSKLDPALRNAPGTVAALIELAPAPAFAATKPVRRSDEDIVEFRRRLVAHLQAQAQVGQRGLRDMLAVRGIAHRPFWIVNAVRVEADAATLAAISTRTDVRHVHADAAMRMAPPEAEAAASRGAGEVAWGVARIRAPQVWAAGIDGSGVVIGGQDTGYRWDHGALRAAYRGWNGVSASHHHNWHDAIHALIGGGSNPCGLSSPVPCDDGSHGTHTMGTMIGDDGGANRIGVAPGARWIGCRNMERGNGTPSTYTECFQWFLAPTDLAGNDANPSLAPDVINNSWGCPPYEGCTTPAILRDVVETVRDAGIVVVVSAGNDGPACGTITTPAAIYDASFTVGSTTDEETMSMFSSRGPVPAGGGSAIKPDVVAPGSSIRSAIADSAGSYGNMSGTSMAGPHVAGTVALLIDTDSNLRGDVARIEQILRETAVPVAHGQTCGGIAPSAVPNYVSGHGRIDAWAAFRVAETIFVDGHE
jgi:serine protease AprX